MITKLQVKYIQSLGQKKFRDETGEFVAEGPKIINDLLQVSPASMQQIYSTADWLNSNPGFADSAVNKLNILSERELERLSFLQTPNQVLAVFKKPMAKDSVDFSQKVSLMLDGIQDPGNMGTVIRIADWFGVENIFCSADCADAFAPKVVQASMGSLLRVHIVYTNLVEMAAKTSVELYATTLNGKNVYLMEPLQKGIIVIGSEGRGTVM